MINIGAIDKFAARLLMVSFFLPMKLQGLASMATGVYFVVRALMVKQPIPRRNFLAALFLSSAFLLHFAAMPFTPHEYLKPLRVVSEHRASLLFMPFVFAIAAPAFSAIIANELYFFVYACFVTAVAANADFLYHIFGSGQGVHHLTHMQYRTVLHLFTDIHPTYMGIYLCFAICILLCMPGLMKWVRYVLLFSLFVFLLALSPKASLLALAVILVHYAWIRRHTLLQHKMLLGGFAATIAAAWFLIPFFRQRVMETIVGFEGQDQNTVDNSISMRKVIWNMDTSLIREHWLTGVGPGRLMHTLREHYFFYFLDHPQPVTYYDPHSEYFYEWLCFGIGGLLLFAAILFAHFRKALISKEHLYLYLMLILAIGFFTETVLSLQRGVLFYAIFTSLFFFSNQRKTIVTS